MFADARFINIQTDDKGTHDQYVMPLDTPYGCWKIAVLHKIEFLAEFPQSFGRRGFKSDENATASGLFGQHQELFVIGEIDGSLANPFLSQVRLC